MRAAWALALVSILLAAGCVSTAPETPAATTDAQEALAATAGVVHTAAGLVPLEGSNMSRALGGQYFHGFSSSEPTLGVTGDGALFMTANVPNPTCQACPPLPYANFQKGPTLMRTLDKGQTWEDVFPKLPTGDSMKLRTWDPYVYVDVDTGRVFMDDIYPISCGFLSWSDDLGSNWEHNPYSCGNSQVNDHQTLVTAFSRAGTPTLTYPKLVYRCVNNLVYAACAVSNTGGQTFLPQIPIVGAAQKCAAITGHLEADREGRVYLPLPCGDEQTPSVVLTEDDGRTWEVFPIDPAHPIDALEHDVDLATDEAGNVYAVWTSGGRLWMSASTDHGRTWREGRLVTPHDVTATMFGAIAAGAPGRVAFAYVGTTVPGGYENKPDGECQVGGSTCTDPEEWANATWNGYIGMMVDALDPDAPIQTVTANDPADPLARGFCGHSRCHGMTDFLDIVIDFEGRPWASFVDVCTEACVDDPATHFDVNMGFVGTLQAGPALRGGTELPTLQPPPLRG